MSLLAGVAKCYVMSLLAGYRLFLSLLTGDAKCYVMSLLAGYRLLRYVPVSWGC